VTFLFRLLPATRALEQTMPRKSNPFAHQPHPGPNWALSPKDRFEAIRPIGEYLLHVSDDGTESCFLRPPRSLHVIDVTVFTQSGREFDVTKTWLHGDAHAAMLRLRPAYGWRITGTEKHHARWERPAPAHREFVG
jgi:hypothetical protein